MNHNQLKIQIAVSLFFLLAGSFQVWADNGKTGAAQEQEATIPKDLLNILGMDLERAYKDFGAPQEVFCYRDDKSECDDVVFYYKSHIYFFWFENRVWVVRLDKRFTGEFLGVKIGMPKTEVLAVLGSQFKEADNSLIFYLPDRGFAVRLRLFFEEEKLSDIYLYRGDY